MIAVTHAGLTGLEAGLTHVATGAVPADLIQRSRGWTDAEWDGARRRLVARGLLDRGGGSPSPAAPSAGSWRPPPTGWPRTR